MNRWCFLLVLCILVLLPDSSFGAQAYGTYGFYPQGSSRVLAMGGAFVGLSDDASAAYYNPAGLVMTRWRFDVSSDSNRIINKEVDLTGDDRPDGLPYSVSSTAFATRWKSLGIAAGLTDQYDLAFDFGGLSNQSNQIKVQSYDFAIAWAFSKKFSMGATYHQETGTVAFRDGTTGAFTEDSETGSYYTLGLLLRPNSKFGFGVTYKPERRYDIDESFNSTTSTSWFHDIFIPAKTTIGFMVKTGSRLKWTFDMDQFTGGKDVIYVGSTGTYYSDQSQTVMRAGFEYSVVSDKTVDFVWRGGGYKEPSRISGLSSRLHFTMGVSVRWNFLTFAASYDQAADFSTTAQSAGISVSALSNAM